MNKLKFIDVIGEKASIHGQSNPDIIHECLDYNFVNKKVKKLVRQGPYGTFHLFNFYLFEYSLESYI